MNHVVHLHGFCSSPDGTKAQFLRERFGRLDIQLIAPDLNLPSFFDLTITRQIETAREVIRRLDRPVALMGSSMGALVALHYAEIWGDVDRMVLFAPALDLATGLRGQLTDRFIEEWQATGTAMFQHFGYDRMEPLSYNLMTDLQRYPTDHLELAVPTLILQGLRDELCPAAKAIQFAERRPHVSLVLLDTDHHMNDCLDRMFEEIRGFLEI